MAAGSRSILSKAALSFNTLAPLLYAPQPRPISALARLSLFTPIHAIIPSNAAVIAQSSSSDHGSSNSSNAHDFATNGDNASLSMRALGGASAAALVLLLLSIRSADCSPSFQGIPVAATFLMAQAIAPFESVFPGLQISPVFAPGIGGHVYEESGGIMGVYPTLAVVELPVFERLSQKEEERLGIAGIRKSAVGVLRMTGDCKYGCASVKLATMTLYALLEDGSLDRQNPVWTWTAPSGKSSSSSSSATRK
eukprot:jgi/Hompol1/1487/HPOL_005612-RA